MFPPAIQMDVSYKPTETSTVTRVCMLEYKRTVQGTRSSLAYHYQTYDLLPLRLDYLLLPVIQQV